MTGDTAPVDPAPARVVMVGAGQLARMTQQAAVDLAVPLTVLAASPSDPAVTAGAGAVLGSVDDLDDLRRAAAEGDVVTFDHELVDPDHLAALAADGCVLRPGPGALRMAQDKLAARTRMAAEGFPVPAFAPAGAPADVAAFAAEHGWPVVLKARRGGYDGRGVQVLAGPADVASAFGRGGFPAGWLVEAHVDFASELAVAVARRPSGATATYDPVTTVQHEGQLAELLMPAQVAPEVAAAAVTLATSLAARIDATGICAVEMFVTRDGGLLVNEVATRPHNSAHATIEACVTSQFQQHLRAVLDWPLGSTRMVAPAAASVNVIGGAGGVEPTAVLPAALAHGDVAVHLYGKASRPGRKLGHVTALAGTANEALERARTAARALGGR